MHKKEVKVLCLLGKFIHKQRKKKIYNTNKRNNTPGNIIYVHVLAFNFTYMWFVDRHKKKMQ